MLTVSTVTYVRPAGRALDHPAPELRVPRHALALVGHSSLAGDEDLRGSNGNIEVIRGNIGVILK